MQTAATYERIASLEFRIWHYDTFQQYATARQQNAARISKLLPTSLGDANSSSVEQDAEYDVLYTPLELVARRVNSAVIETLLSTSAAKTSFDKSTLLFTAMMNWHDHLLSCLAKFQEASNFVERFSQSPSPWATGSGKVNTARLLLEISPTSGMPASLTDHKCPITVRDSRPHDGISCFIIYNNQGYVKLPRSTTLCQRVIIFWVRDGSGISCFCATDGAGAKEL
jgi:hypothetical protein